MKAEARADAILILDVVRARPLKGLVEIDVLLPDGKRTLYVSFATASKGLTLVAAVVKAAVLHHFGGDAGAH